MRTMPPSRFNDIANSLARTTAKKLVYRAFVGPGLSGDTEEYPQQELPVVQYPMHTAGATPKTSFLGTPVLVDLQLQLDDISEPLTIDTVMVTVEREKNIVRTQVHGREGTVKEYVDKGDYVIQMVGEIYNDNTAEYPLDDVARLIEIVEADYQTIVVSPFLQQFDIFEVVWESHTLAQSRFKNKQPFELRGYSEKPIQLVDDVETS